MITQMIRIPKHMLADFKWLARAMTKDKSRYALMCFHVEDQDTIVTTDGRRLHMLTSKAHGIPVGNYRIASKSPLIIEADTETTYPNWRQVIPDSSKAKVLKVRDKHMAASTFGKEMGGVLSVDFLSDAFSDSPMDMLAVNAMAAAVLKDETHLVVIMPMRMPREG